MHTDSESENPFYVLILCMYIYPYACMQIYTSEAIKIVRRSLIIVLLLFHLLNCVYVASLRLWLIKNWTSSILDIFGANTSLSLN